MVKRNQFRISIAVWNGLLWALAGSALASAQSTSPDFTWMEHEIHASAAAAFEPQDSTVEQRIDIQLPPDWVTRVQDAPCTPQAEVRSRRAMQGIIQIELRCPQTTWKTRLPVRVQVWREVAVAQRTLLANRPLSDSDWQLEEMDVANLSQDVVTSSQPLQGAEVVRSIRAGNPIPVNAVRAAPALRSGDSVAVILSGQGFEIRTQGRSAQTAVIGDTIRVQINGGSMVSGQVQADHSVRVSL